MMGIFDIVSRRRILIIFSILLLPTIIWILKQRSFISLKVEGTNETITALYTVGGKVRNIKPGLNYVKPGEATINIISNNKQTLASMKVSRLRSNTVSVLLESQKTTTKVVGGTNKLINCIAGSMVILSCQDNQIYKQSYDQKITHENLYPNQKVIGQAVPYKQGVLSIVSDVSDGPAKYKLVHTTTTGQESLVVSNDIVVGAAGNPRIFTSNTDSRFVVLNPTSAEAIIYSGVGKIMSRAKLDNTFFDVDFEQISLTLDDNTMKIAYPIIDKKNQDDVFSGSNAKIKLFNYTISSKKIELMDESTLETGKIGGLLYLSDNTLLILGQDSNLNIFNIKKNKIKLSTTLRRVDNVVIASKRIFYTSNKGLYEYIQDKNQSRLRNDFSSINEARLLVLNNKPVLVGNTNNSVTTFSAYLVNDDSRDDEFNLFNLFPYDTNILPLVSSDYIGNTIFLSVDLKSIIFNRDTGEVSYNKAEFEQKKVIITEKLRSDGVDLSKYTLVFKPGP